MSNIVIEGLSKKQRLFADIMWSLDSTDQVTTFIRSLPKKDRLQAQVVCELMILACIDEVDSVEDSTVDLINSFKD
jgi:hypothetical protein